MREKLLAIAARLERDSEELFNRGDYESQQVSNILDIIVKAIRDELEEL